MSATSAQYGRFAAQLGDAFQQVGRGLGHTWPVLSASGQALHLPPLLRIDYVWHSAALRPIQASTGPSLGSDHRLLRALFALG